jgi:aryl-alcohol dehydrogenase-like predicted oxidoreductase
MRYNQLGRTGLFVSELCLGTMTFGGTSRWAAIGRQDQETAESLIRTSLDHGVNFIDTADVYSEGLSEQILGRALKNLGVRRSDVVIATKVYGAMGPGPNNVGASRAHIMDGVQRSLERLQLDHIDLYQIHANDSVTPVEETVRALDDLVRQGLVRYVGVSNWQAWKIMKALGYAEHRNLARFESLQAYYTIAGRDLERDVVPLLKDQKVGLMVWSPLAGGLLSGKFGPGSNGPEDARRASFDFPPMNRDRAWACVDVMRAVAARHQTSVARVALAWLLAKPWVTTVIMGAKTQEQLLDNLAAADLRLTADDLAELDKVSALPPEYPGWMTEFQGATRMPKPFKNG